MLLLGFYFNIPVTLSKINSFLLGFWPQWQTGIYWYLLIGGVFLILITTRKNVYCNWICPFGAAQECLAVIGGSKFSIPRKYLYYFYWLQRLLAWFAVIMAFYFRNPAKISYEVFGAFFDLTGTVLLFILLTVFIIGALFIKRPWCKVLCPMNALFDFVNLYTDWITGRNKRKNTATPNLN